MNEYHSLLNELSARFPMVGIAMTHHNNTRGQPMSFKDFPYLPSLYNNLPEEGADIQKAVQTGLSEAMIVLTLYDSGWRGRIVGYILPTFAVRDRFVAQRINRILEQSKTYRSFLPSNSRGDRWELGNNKLKRFGSGTLMFLGSNTAVDFVEFSADTIIIDEFDQCDPANLAKARDRLRASADPRMYRLGNPTLPNQGICKLYEESDKRAWFCRCDRCSAWQNLDWFNNFVREDDRGKFIPRDPAVKPMNNWTELQRDIRPVCTKCGQPFNRNGRGEWIAREASVRRAGYIISRLDVLSQSTGELFKEWILAQSDINRLSTFYTSVLGQGFEYSGARITLDHLKECATSKDEYNTDYGGGEEYENRLVSLGVDVGSVLNAILSIAEEDENGEIYRKTILVGAYRNFEEIQDLIIRYRVNCCVVDSMPEMRKGQELRDWATREFSSCYVWLARFYPTARISSDDYGRKLNWRERVVTVDRTQVMDATFEEITVARRSLPIDAFNMIGFVQQMCAPVRVLDSEKGRIRWEEGSNPDHFRLADVYDRVAFDLLQVQGSYSSG
jgi:hypothetical protein